MLRIGIVGAGRYARVHGRHLSRLPGVTLGFYSSGEERAVSFAHDTGATRFLSFEEMLDQVDAVDVVTPTDFHAHYATLALQAGKHILIEKPLDIELERATQLVSLAETLRLVAMTAHVTRYFPMYRKAYDLIQSGQLGKVATARMSRRAKRFGGESSWFFDHERSGGALIDVGVHDFDFLRWALGNVSHIESNSIAAKTRCGDDYALTTLSFASGAVAHVESELREVADPGTQFEFCGSEGMIQWDSKTTPTLKFGDSLEQNFLPDDDPFFRMLEDWVRAIRQEIPVPITLADGLASLEIAIQASQSAKEPSKLV